MHNLLKRILRRKKKKEPVVKQTLTMEDKIKDNAHLIHMTKPEPGAKVH